MEKNNYDVVVIVHRIFTEGKRKKGGADKLIASLSYSKKVLMIEHPLSALKETKDQSFYGAIISEVKKGEILEVKRIKMPRFPIPFNWVLETIFNLFYIVNKVSNKPVLISADPLNALVGVLVPWKFSKRYFHCIDFSERRFENFILNGFYKNILEIVFKSFDYVGVVSLRIKRELLKKNCPAYKIRYIPNSPDYRRISFDNKEPNSLICTGGAVIEKYDYEKIVRIIKEVKIKIPNIKFYAVGGVEQDPDYVNKIKKLLEKHDLCKNFVFTGFLESYKLEKFLLKSVIGISFYSKNVAYYTYFGDSLKIREYALYGIPTICDGNSATDDEMREFKAGFVAKSVEEAVEKIVLLLTDKKIAREYQNNCVEWAKKMDKSKIIKSLTTELF